MVGGQFAELADLLSANLREVEQEPQTFLHGKLVVSSSKRRQGGSGQIEHSTHWILSIKVDWSLLFTPELRAGRFLKNVRKCFDETQGKQGAGPTGPAVANLFVILWTVEVDLLAFWWHHQVLLCG